MGEAAAPAQEPAPSSAPERRQITILFSDLVGSTRISQRLDPEDLSALIQEYQREVVAVVERFEGHIAQYLGDGVLVYFGYPRAHERDAERAVRAGLDIVNALRRMDEEWGSKLGEPLKVRVGIHTGEVLIGDVGGGERYERLALGEAPPVAARLMAAAPPDGVVVSPATRRLIGGRFRFEDLGTRVLKGVEGPVSVSRVVEVVETASRFEVTDRIDPAALVGRFHELALLKDRWNVAAGGDGQAVLITGEAGLGKSRLLRELEHAMAPDPPVTLRFECSPFHTSSAYQPLIHHLEVRLGLRNGTAEERRYEVLREHVVETAGLSEHQAQLIASLLGIPVPTSLESGQLSPTARKRDTIEAFVELACAASRTGPALILFEDAHWADPTTLEFLEGFLERIATRPLLLVLTYRPEFTPTWTRYGHVAALALSSLSRDQARDLIFRLADQKALPSRLSDEILAKAGGIPLFLEELTRTVLESGQLQERAGRYELTVDDARLEVPVTLRASLMARLDRDPGAKEMAQIGSVIGRTFDASLLAEVSAVDEARVSGDLVGLVETGILVGGGTSGRFTFRHALLRDLAYGSIPRTRRAVLHRAIAEILEAGGEAAPELLAHHWTHGGSPEQAVPHWHRAGSNAVEQHANVEAIRHLSQGIEQLAQLPETPERTRRMLEMQIALGAPLIATQGYGAEHVRQCFDRARELCRAVGPTPELFHVLWGLTAYYLIRADLAMALDLAEECLDLAERGENADHLLEAHSWLGTVAFYRGRMAQAQVHFDAGLEIYGVETHRLHAIEYGLDPAVLCRVHLIWKHWLEGRTAEALAEEEGTLDLARRLGHPFSLVHALNFASVHSQLRREPSRTQDIVERELALSSEHQFRHYVAYATVLGGWAEAALGNPRVGSDRIREGLAARRATGAELARPYFLTLLSEALRRDGDLEAATMALNDADVLARETEERWWWPEVRRLQGELLLAREAGGDSGGPVHLARQHFLEAYEMATAQSAATLALRAASSLARLSLHSGRSIDPEAAGRLERALDAMEDSSKAPEVREARALLRGDITEESLP